nr:MAG TPA: hypothetical protein [Caudoviricetes sp.]
MVNWSRQNPLQRALFVRATGIITKKSTDVIIVPLYSHQKEYRGIYVVYIFFHSTISDSLTQEIYFLSLRYLRVSSFKRYIFLLSLLSK